MVCCTIDTIRDTTKIQVGTFILLLFCFIFCVYTMRFISMVIVKVIIFTCVIHAVTVCGRNQKQLLAIRRDHYSVYDNKNKGGRRGGILDELNASDN